MFNVSPKQIIDSMRSIVIREKCRPWVNPTEALPSDTAVKLSLPRFPRNAFEFNLVGKLSA